MGPPDLFNHALLFTLAWGALAFGAEYAWAYAPLLVLCAVTGILGLRAARGTPPARTLLMALSVIFLACAAQVLVPSHAVPRQGTAAEGVDFERLYAFVTMQPQPQSAAAARLSIAPGRTLLGMTFFAAFCLLLAGCTRGISATGPKRLARGIAAIGVIVAFAGIVQSAVRPEAIYGFWRPPRPGGGFAPFLNENHFAGWMAMALSLSIGAFAGDVAVALERVAPNWRDRLLWFSSQRASAMILTAFAAGVMALSMVLTISRGGLVGLAAVLLIGCWWMLRRQSGPRRLAGAVTVGVLIVFAAIWGGADRTIDQFAGASENMGGRAEIWNDTWRIVQDRPYTGTGLNTFGIAMLHYQTAPIATGAVIEAHNDYLQLAAEGGLLLGIPILLALAIFVREIWRRFKEAADDAETYWLRAGAVTGLLAIAGMEMFDFTLQMPGAAALFVVLAATAIHKPNHLRHTPRRTQPGRASVIWQTARAAVLTGALASCLSGSIYAQDTWSELRGGDFVLRGTLNAERLGPIACDVDKALRTLGLPRPGASPPSAVPSIVAAASEKEMRELLPHFWERRGPRPLGGYWAGLYGHHIAVRVDARPDERLRRLLHELAHYATHLAHPDPPRWLDEGLSEVWAHAAIEEGAIEIGRPVARHVRALGSDKNWIPVSELLEATTLPEGRRGPKASMFYAESWALVHYLLFEKGNGKSFLNSLPEPADIPTDEMLKNYARGGLANPVRIAAAAPGDCRRAAEARDVPRIETLILKARALADGERPDAALPLLDEALRLQPDDADALETLGFVHFLGNRPRESAAAFDRLIAAGGESHVAYYYRALLAAPVPGLTDGSGPVPELEYLRRAVHLNPEFRPATDRLRERLRKGPGNSLVARQGQAVPD